MDEHQVLGMKSVKCCVDTRPWCLMELRLQQHTHSACDMLPELVYTDTEHERGPPASGHAAAVNCSSDAKNQM